MSSALFISLGLTVLVSQPKADDKIRFGIGEGIPSSQFAHPHTFYPGYFGDRPYWHNPYYPFRYYPYRPGYAYGYPYLHRYYNNYENSPYPTLEVKPAGELMIEVEQTQAEILVDGYQLRPSEDFTYAIGLLTGKHQVEVRAKGYKPYFIEAEIKTGKRTSLSIQLEEKEK